MSSVTTCFPSIVSGTSPVAIFCARPSATAVFPTPGSPIRHGLFLVRRPRICVTRSISFLRPTTGSSLPSVACVVRLVPYSSSVGILLEEAPPAPPAPPPTPTASCDSPTIRMTCVRILAGSAPSVSSTRAATPSPSRSSPRRMCSVPM